MKRDLLLKECSAYFYEMYFEDKNFKNLKRLFLHKYLHHPWIKLRNKQDKLNCPVILKNYSNTEYAYPQIYFRSYDSFYNQKTLNISHPYFNKNVIKKSSFPYFLSHYHGLKSIIENIKEEKTLYEFRIAGKTPGPSAGSISMMSSLRPLESRNSAVSRPVRPEPITDAFCPS